MAHMLRNYDDCNEDDSPLHMLIPRTADKLGNEMCRMFVKGEPATDQERSGLTNADVKYLKWRERNRPLA